MIENIKKVLTNRYTIVIILALVSVLTLGITTPSYQQSNALGFDDLSSINGLSGLSLSNNCVAFECNNQQTVDNSKTITGNTNSNIVSESDNTNIGTQRNSSQSNPSDGSNPPLTCVECFENAGLTPNQEQLILQTYDFPSFEAFCAAVSGGGGDQENFTNFLITQIGLETSQAQALAKCLTEAGILNP